LGKNTLRGDKRTLGGQKYTKYNKINNNSKNLRRGKIGAGGGGGIGFLLPLCG